MHQNETKIPIYFLPGLAANASIFKNINDTVLLVDKGKKEVSSSFGHDLMNGHSFSSDRIKQAHNNLKQLNKALENGNYDLFIKIVEIEALSLHAMMMTSQPYFILIKFSLRLCYPQVIIPLCHSYYCHALLRLVMPMLRLILV